MTRSDWPEPMNRVWHDAKGRPWLVEVQFAPVAGRLECVGVAVRGYRGEARLREVPQSAAVPMTAELLRRVPVGAIVSELRGHMVRQHADSTVVILDDDAAEPSPADEKRLQRMWAGTPRGGPRLGLDHYREVARVYTEAWLAGAAPTQAVARRFSLTLSGAAKQVQKARALDFLSDAPGPGRAGVLPEGDR